MNEEQLREHLHRHGDGLQVGPPPHSGIRRVARRRRGRALVTGTAALVAAIVLGAVGMQYVVSAGSLSDGRGDDVAAADPTDPADTRIVPALVGVQIEEARRQLEGIGLRVRELAPVGSACVPAGQVVDQKPTAGSRVPPGSRVTAFVSQRRGGRCGLQLPAVPEDLDRVASLFVQFAEGERDRLPADAPVDLYFGGRFVKTVPSARLADRREWQACPEGGYAGRSCPISALTLFASFPGRIAFTSRDPAHPCAHPAEPPSSLGAYRTVTLTPDESRDCTAYFAVQLFVDDVGQIVATNLVMSEP